MTWRWDIHHSYEEILRRCSRPTAIKMKKTVLRIHISHTSLVWPALPGSLEDYQKVTLKSGLLDQFPHPRGRHKHEADSSSQDHRSRNFISTSFLPYWVSVLLQGNTQRGIFLLTKPPLPSAFSEKADMSLLFSIWFFTMALPQAVSHSYELKLVLISQKVKHRHLLYQLSKPWPHSLISLSAGYVNN